MIMMVVVAKVWRWQTQSNRESGVHFRALPTALVSVLLDLTGDKRLLLSKSKTVPFY